MISSIFLEFSQGIENMFVIDFLSNSAIVEDIVFYDLSHSMIGADPFN